MFWGRGYLVTFRACKEKTLVSPPRRVAKNKCPPQNLRPLPINNERSLNRFYASKIVLPIMIHTLYACDNVPNSYAPKRDQHEQNMMIWLIPVTNMVDLALFVLQTHHIDYSFNFHINYYTTHLFYNVLLLITMYKNMSLGITLYIQLNRELNLIHLWWDYVLYMQPTSKIRKDVT